MEASASYISRLTLPVTQKTPSAKGQGKNTVLPPVTHTPISAFAVMFHMFPANDGTSSTPT